MIDFTRSLSSAYSKHIEASGPTEAEIDWQALQILRGLTLIDVSEVLYDLGEQLRDMVIDGKAGDIGALVDAEIKNYCRRIACRMLEQQ